MSEVKPPILTDEQIVQAAMKGALLGLNPYPPLEGQEFSVCYGVAEAQRDADWKHEQQTVREIFEEIEKRWKQYKYALIAGTRKEETYFIFCSDNPEWEAFKSRYEEEK